MPKGSCYHMLAFGPSGVVAAAAGSALHFLEAASGKLLEAVDAHDGNIAALRWSPRGGLLATAGADARVRLWRSPT